MLQRSRSHNVIDVIKPYFQGLYITFCLICDLCSNVRGSKSLGQGQRSLGQGQIRSATNNSLLCVVQMPWFHSSCLVAIMRARTRLYTCNCKQFISNLAGGLTSMSSCLI